MAIVLRFPKAWQRRLDAQETEWAYNGLDAAATAEIYETLAPQIEASPAAKRIYAFERICQGPAMTMQLRGIRIDVEARREAIARIKRDAKRVQKELSALVSARGAAPMLFTGRGFPPSTQKVQTFLYEHCGVKARKNFDGGTTADKEALLAIAKQHPEVTEFCDKVLLLRDWQKQHEVLSAAVSSDGRMRCSFSVGATETGRWSSSSSPFGDGMNLFNIDRRLRSIFVPDPGYMFVGLDYAQAESNCIAHLAEDENYIEAHKSGNVHVVAGRIFWPELSWTGDVAKDKAMMKNTQVPWRTVVDDDEPADTYYDQSKRAQHGLNYGLQAQGLARNTGMPLAAARVAHSRYFRGYPRIPIYHDSVAAQVKKYGSLTSPLGRKRQFFGRLWETSTLREALANTPQGMVADALNIGLCHIWQELDPDKCQILLTNYDSVLAQVRDGDTETVAHMKELLTFPITVNGRAMVIPVEADIGHSWAEV